MRDLIIKNNKGSKIITLVENGKLIEQYEESEDKKRIEGNIYVGIVESIFEGMQAAFVDIGEGKNAFIHIKDLLPKMSNETGNKYEKLDKFNIKDFLKCGQAILVQVKKDSSGKKGARIASNLNIPGNFVALIPDFDFITISQKIEKEEERDRLRNIIEQKKIGKNAIIVRTAAKGKTQQQISKDIDDVLNKYRMIKEKFESIDNSRPRLIYENSDLIEKTINDTIYQGLDRIIVDDKKVYSKIERLMSYFDDKYKIHVELKEDGDIFDIYNINEQLEKSKNRRVWLKCGGFITIDKTEALTAIDVNSGKYTGNKDVEKTILKVNMEASNEIAKQLRLRDIGGIIIIDYIDMQEQESRQKVIDALQLELKKDRTKTQIIGFTKLDLLEITRKHISNN
ncbi:MAG: Rne/Rng family ribonuclease [Clostridia bacterium]|nr:Rne/Rng family ribonuclease [Clostridia bacterium]